MGTYLWRKDLWGHTYIEMFQKRRSLKEIFVSLSFLMINQFRSLRTAKQKKVRAYFRAKFRPN